MTRDRVKELLPIMQAFAEGKVIQCRNKEAIDFRWRDIDTPSWIDNLVYRIKPEPHYMPFTYEDHKLFKDKWITCRDSKVLKHIVCVYKESVAIINNTMPYSFSYESLLRDYNFEDGTPCGKLVE